MPNGGTLRIMIDTIRSSDPVPPMLSAGEYARVVVADTGIGIPEDLQTKIFDPSPPNKKATVSALQPLTRSSGSITSRISVESRPGKGSSFHIHLPASEWAAASRRQTRSPYCRGTRTGADHGRRTGGAWNGWGNAGLGYRCAVCGRRAGAFDGVLGEDPEGVPFMLIIMDITVPGGMGGKRDRCRDC